jgi:ParG
MSKTVAFPSARQPTADEWVSGASTETQKPVNAERRKSATTETRKSGGKLARLTIDLPEELHGQFKAACATRRTKMKDEVLAFIEQWTQKHS